MEQAPELLSTRAKGTGVSTHQFPVTGRGLSLIGRGSINSQALLAAMCVGRVGTGSQIQSSGNETKLVAKLVWSDATGKG